MPPAPASPSPASAGRAPAPASSMSAKLSATRRAIAPSACTRVFASKRKLPSVWTMEAGAGISAGLATASAVVAGSTAWVATSFRAQPASAPQQHSSATMARLRRWKNRVIGSSSSVGAKKTGPDEPGRGGKTAAGGVRLSEPEAEVEVVLASVAVEGMRQVAGHRVVLGVIVQRRVVEVQRVQADRQPVGGLDSERGRQRAEVVLVAVVGTADAGVERAAVAVAHARIEAIVLEPARQVEGVLRRAVQRVAAARFAIDVGVVGVDAEVLADGLLVGQLHAPGLALGIDRNRHQVIAVHVGSGCLAGLLVLVLDDDVAEVHVAGHVDLEDARGQQGPRREVPLQRGVEVGGQQRVEVRIAAAAFVGQVVEGQR